MIREIEDRIIELSNTIDQSYWNIDDWMGDIREAKANIREERTYIRHTKRALNKLIRLKRRGK